MTIHCFDDFVRELLATGFSLSGENGEGVFSLSSQFGNRIKWHTENPETDPWEWRMRVLEEREDIAYGKVFFKKGGFITKGWYPYFLAVRRKGQSFDEVYQSGSISYEAKRIYQVISQVGQIALHTLKRECGFFGKNTRFDAALIELQMKMFVTICGRQYKSTLNTGWSSTVLCTSESFFGREVFDIAESIDEKEAFCNITEQIFKLNPYADDRKVKRFING